jgi:hypothetical protein
MSPAVDHRISAMLRLLTACTLLVVPLRATPAQVDGEQNAEQAYKNVQVLKGVSVSNFMNTMFFQRYALGVSCDYCHMGNDWASDDKPEKEKARKMLALVMDINQKSFEGEPVVTCMTCHRGSIATQNAIPGVRMSLREMGVPKPQVTPPKPPAGTTVDGVIARYIAAIGGTDALGKIRNRVSKGELTSAAGTTAPFEDTYAMGPVSSLSVRHLGGKSGDYSAGFDGTVGWSVDSAGLTELRGEARAELAMNAEFENRLNMRKLYSRWTVAGIENVGTAPAIVLAATSTVTGRKERLFFDAGSGLLVRRSVATESVFGAFTTDTYYEEYRPVDGVTVPMMVSEFTPDFGTIRKVTSVAHNAQISATSFAKPAAARRGTR